MTCKTSVLMGPGEWGYPPVEGASAGSTHLAALHHLMEYIEGLTSFKITYRRRIKHNQDLLSGYADSDWGNSSSRRSTSGNLMLYYQAPIMWRSKMQKTTALSTAEAEYYSASTAGSDVLYLRKLLDQLGFNQQSPTVGPTPVYEDNPACIEKQHHRGAGARQAH
jgi:hypothetical protein